MDDAETFQETKEAMQLLGIHSESQRMMFRVLGAILHLGNVQIGVNSKKEDESAISVRLFPCCSSSIIYNYFSLIQLNSN